ncbi:MAG: hypothetical protein KIS78_19045 [Labilithrix sp.]|nr:hypothetical protein [Labilithrix sp.]
MNRGFEESNARLSGIETTVDTLVEDGKAANQRMTRIEIRMDSLEGRASTQSDRVRETSEVNLKQDAAIAQILTTVEEIKAKPDTAAIVLEKVSAIGQTPTGQKIVGALVTVLLLSLTLLAANLQRKVDALEDRPATVQPAPTVYLPVTAPPTPPPDGGAP